MDGIRTEKPHGDEASSYLTRMRQKLSARIGSLVLCQYAHSISRASRPESDQRDAALDTSLAPGRNLAS